MLRSALSWWGWAVHNAVLGYVEQFATTAEIDVLDIGGRNVNGTTQPLFPNARYTVLDIREGENVDIVTDAAVWTPDKQYDLIVSTECFEHTPDYPAICATAYAACRPGGRFVVTCAGPGRASHSAFVEAALQPGEFYQNVEPHKLQAALEAAGWRDVRVDMVGLDLQATAVR